MIESSHRAASETPHLYRIFEEHGEFVRARLRRLDVAEDELEDATQEVFLVVLQRTEDYEERGRLRAWLHSICTRVAWNRQRSRRRSREDLVAAFDLEVSATQHDWLVTREALLFGRRVLEGLPIEQFNVFWLYEVEEEPMADIARAAKCPLQTAYSRLHRARARIQAALKAEEEPSASDGEMAASVP